MMAGRTILVIEDDAILVTVIEELLKFEGLNVLIARDASTGIRLSGEAHPDLILCDVNLLHGDGYTVFNTLQKDNFTKTIPFLFMTAAHDFDEIQRNTSISRENIIRKPFDVAAFLVTVRHWL